MSGHSLDKLTIEQVLEHLKSLEEVALRECDAIEMGSFIMRDLKRYEASIIKKCYSSIKNLSENKELNDGNQETRPRKARKKQAINKTSGG